MHADDPLQHAELTFLLGMSFQLLLAEFNRRVHDVGYEDLRPVHGMAFQALKHGGLTSSELAERLGVTKQAAGQVVDDLEKRGYVLRGPHPAGGRRRLVLLTDAALRHLDVAGRIMHGMEEELAAVAGGVDLVALRAQLARLIRQVAGDDLPPLRPLW